MAGAEGFVQLRTGDGRRQACAAGVQSGEQENPVRHLQRHGGAGAVGIVPVVCGAGAAA